MLPLDGQSDSEGLRRKYVIYKAADSSGGVAGEPLDGEAFVLRYDRDPHARVALAAYADSVEVENPTLAAELRTVLDG